MKISNNQFGIQIESDHFKAILGNRNSQADSLKSAFPELQFKRIKQIHGDRIIHTSPHSIDFSSEADAHYTNEKKLGLCISTADCVPVLFFHPNPQWISIVHAGWRGIEKRIIPKMIFQMKKLGCDSQKLQVFVGPHIQRLSFEVETSVRDQLLKSCTGSDSTFWDVSSTGKSKVDLHLILQAQLRDCAVTTAQTYFEMIDTVTDLSFHSYRRDKDDSGRQLSFLYLK